tara:strand:+ start:183 stop:629 length:447 start_codon:yes stop_codon:yes gene_type:complete
MNIRRILFIAGGVIGLIAVYLLQSYLDFYSMLFELEAPNKIDYTAYQNVKTLPFTVNKVVRYLLNDLFSIAIIYGLFYEKKYARFAMYVMFFGLFVLVPVYIFLFLNQFEGFSSMLSHLHRVVMNPVLMMLLIPAFFYQRKMQGQQSS